MFYDLLEVYVISHDITMITYIFIFVRSKTITSIVVDMKFK